MDDLDIDACVSAYADGAISREEYWSCMQRHHRCVAGYPALLREGGVESIVVDRDGAWVVLGNGITLLWNPEDIRTAPNILLNHGSYEAEETRALVALARDSKCVLDIGANQGWYSTHVGRTLEETGGRVFAFEPVATTYAVLCANLERNALGDVVTANNFGFGEAAGTVEFFIPAFTGSVGASREQLFPDDENRAVTCEIRVLDEFVAAQGIAPDLIKCDVEGSELMVLRGAEETLRSARPVVMLEMLRKWAKRFGYHPNDIIEHMARFDYDCWYLEEGALLPIEAVDDETTATNFFFFHRSQPHRREEMLAHLGREHG